MHAGCIQWKTIWKAGLLVNCELCTGKYLSLFVQIGRRRSEITEGKYFPVQTEQTRLIRLLLYGFWFIFFAVFSAVFVFRCCVYLTSEFVRFASCLHPVWTFICLAYRQTAFKKCNTNIPGRVIRFEIFQRTYLNLFYFHLNQLTNFPAKTYQSAKKHIALSQRRESNTLFSGPLGNQSAYAIT